jgi:segregation and condensation protein B
MHVLDKSERSMKSRFGVQRIEVELDAASEAERALDSVDQARTLEELSEAYAKLLEASGQQADQPSDSSESKPSLSDKLTDAEVDAEDESTASVDGVPVSPEGIIEAILFVGDPNNRGLTADELAGLMRGVDTSEVYDIVNELNARYQRNAHVLRIVENAGRFQMSLVEDLQGWQGTFTGKLRETQLNQSALDCLALVAYQPGATREEVEILWGRAASQPLSLLVRRELLRVERQGHGKEAKNHYYPTERFLSLVGIESLNDLPRTDGEV